MSSFGYSGTIVHTVLHCTTHVDIPCRALPPLRVYKYKRRVFPLAERASPCTDAPSPPGTSMRSEVAPPVIALDPDTRLMEAGFTSVIATRLAADMRVQLGTILSPMLLFDHPTPRMLHAHLHQEVPALPAAFHTVEALTRTLEAFYASACERFSDPTDAVGAIGERVQLASQLEADVELEPEITPAMPDVASSVMGEPRVMLLTGCTGFLGAFLLAELLRQTDATIYCLVRAANALDGRRRLEDTLCQYELASLPLHRCVVCVGDIACAHLGLSPEDYTLLAHLVDAIWHNGARVDHVLSYGRLRASNVRGTAEVLRLAATGRAKAVHFVSTNATCLPAVRSGKVCEDAPLPSATQLVDAQQQAASHLVNGYVQSKWAAERLCSRHQLVASP